MPPRELARQVRRGWFGAGTRVYAVKSPQKNGLTTTATAITMTMIVILDLVLLTARAAAAAAAAAARLPSRRLLNYSGACYCLLPITRPMFGVSHNHTSLDPIHTQLANAQILSNRACLLLPLHLPSKRSTCARRSSFQFISHFARHTSILSIARGQPFSTFDNQIFPNASGLPVITSI